MGVQQRIPINNNTMKENNFGGNTPLAEAIAWLESDLGAVIVDVEPQPAQQC